MGIIIVVVVVNKIVISAFISVFVSIFASVSVLAFASPFASTKLSLQISHQLYFVNTLQLVNAPTSLVGGLLEHTSIGRKCLSEENFLKQSIFVTSSSHGGISHKLLRVSCGKPEDFTALTKLFDHQL